MDLMKVMLENSIKRVEEWVEDHDYKSYEPFDGQLSYMKSLTFGNLLLERLLQQLVRQSPINLRPVLGVKPQESTKGRGYMAWGYLAMYKYNKDKRYLEKAKLLLNWLDNNKSHHYSKHSWANHFDMSSRGGCIPKYEPIIVWTSLIGQTFLDAYELMRDQKYLSIAQSICDWIMDLPRENTDRGSCLSYVKFKQNSIHNSNMLGAAMLARTAKFNRDNEYVKVAKKAMIYSCSRQLSNGAWYYGEASNSHWIDNFHTGYNLDSLKCYIESTHDKDFEDNLRIGYNYYKNTFFEANGRPKYYHNRVYPVDSQCASQSIETLSNFSDYDEGALDLAMKVAKWTIENMQDKDGYFYYRQYPLGIKAKTPMLHWAQATTYKALALLLLKIS